MVLSKLLRKFLGPKKDALKVLDTKRIECLTGEVSMLLGTGLVTIQLYCHFTLKLNLHPWAVPFKIYKQSHFIWSEGDRQKVNPAAVVIHTSSIKSKHVKICKLTNTRLPGRMRVCVREGTCMYDYSSGNNSPTGVNEASDWRSSPPVSTEYGRQSGWEAKRLREPRWGDGASRETVLMGNVKRCSGGRVWLAPRLHCASRSHLGDDPCLSLPVLRRHPE